MHTAELINKLLDRADGSLDQLKLHYGPLIRYVITPILPDARDREDVFSDILIRVWDRIGQPTVQTKDGVRAVSSPVRFFAIRVGRLTRPPSIPWGRKPIRRTPFSGGNRPPRMCSRSFPCPTGAKTTGAMFPIPSQSARTAGVSTAGSTTPTRLPGPSIPSSPPKKNSRPWVSVLPTPSKPFRMPCSFSRGADDPIHHD